jgi:hypothetical protein
MKLTGGFVTDTIERPARIEWTGDGPLTSYSGKYVLEEVEGGTRVTEETVFRPKGLGRLFQPFMPAQFKGTYEAQLHILKKLLEVES